MSKQQAPKQKRAPKGPKNVAHGASRGRGQRNGKAPKGRKQPLLGPARELRIIPLPLNAEVRSGDSIPDLLLDVLKDNKIQSGDILIIKHKIVSKAEGQLVALNKIKPSAASRRWAERYQLDARVIGL